MFIGEVAKSTGASRKAIYLYEKQGLITAPRRRGTYRWYQPEVVKQIANIRCAQSLGFRLKELAEVLNTTHIGAQPHLNSILEQIAHKRAHIEAQIESALSQLELLRRLEQNLQSTPNWLACNDALDPAP